METEAERRRETDMEPQREGERRDGGGERKDEKKKKGRRKENRKGLRIKERSLGRMGE